MNNKPLKILLILFSSVIVLASCQLDSKEEKENDRQQEQDVETAVLGEKEEVVTVKTSLQNIKGERVGKATLTQTDDGVLISLEAENLSPGTHGFHIHENGVCEAPTFESAGAHFNPTNAEHGFDNPKGPHAGDLLNIVVQEDGKIRTEVLAQMVTLERGQANSLLKKGGTSLMIHSKADDYLSQPAGDAGNRIACGVIKEE